jgi:hypothetical protein
MSDTAEVRLNRGSTWMTFVPRSFASITHWKPTGWFSAMLEPMIRIASAFNKSGNAVVAPPRPNVVPRPGTVELCQIRAWLLMQTIPSPAANSFLMR